MKRKYVYGAVAAAVFCILALTLWHVWQASRPDAVAGEKTVTVTVTHGAGSPAEFTYRTELEYLGELLQQEGLISGSDSEYGLFVDTVDGETVDYARDQSWWRLTCNGEDAGSGANTVVLRDGDAYEWICTTG